MYLEPQRYLGLRLTLMPQVSMEKIQHTEVLKLAPHHAYEDCMYLITKHLHAKMYLEPQSSCWRYLAAEADMHDQVLSHAPSLHGKNTTQSEVLKLPCTTSCIISWRHILGLSKSEGHLFLDIYN